MSTKNSPQVLKSEMRTDSVAVGDDRYSSEGYFYDSPILTRTGIFPYHLEDGTIRRELRRPEDVFDPDSLASYEGKPVIITHDARSVDTDNVRREEVGCILTPGQQDGETVRAKIVLHDPTAVKASGLRELSLGYYQDLIMQPGEWEGQPYDAIQTNIRVNHLALVAVARAGEDARLNMDSQDDGGMKPMDENEKKTTETMDDENAVVDPNKQTEDDDAVVSAPSAPPNIDPEAFKVAMQAYMAAIAGGTADDDTDPASGEDPNKPTEDEGDDATTPDILADITARRDAMEDGPAKDDINTLLSMLDAANARADAAEDDTKPTEDGDDCSDNQMNHDSADAIAAQVSQRVNLCRLGDKLHLSGMETLPVMQAKKKVIKAVIPGMRLDGKSNAYINAAFDIAKDKVNGRKTVNDQRKQVFNVDSANAACRQGQNQKYDPDAARNKMIQRHAAEKED